MSLDTTPARPLHNAVVDPSIELSSAKTDDDSTGVDAPGPSRIPLLLSLIFSHTLVDTCAVLIGPLWGMLRDRFEWGQSALSLVLTVQALSPSLSQGVFGYFRDRREARYLLWLGPMTAAICASVVGYITNSYVLCASMILAGIGIGAYHPEAAVSASRIYPQYKTRVLSLFLFGGCVGLAAGPVISGMTVAYFDGMKGLIVIGPIFVVLIGLTYWFGLSKLPTQPVRAAGPAKSFHEMLEGKLGLALLILLTSSTRLVPNMAMDKLLAFYLSAKGESPFVIGCYQSVFLASASIGMLLMAWRFPAGGERKAMMICPLIGLPLMWGLSQEHAPAWMMLVLLIPSGAILWGTTSAMVSFAHQQFPQGAGVASALTMGVSWGVGGIIQAQLTSIFVLQGHPQRAFLAFIPCLLISATGAYFLPGPRKTAE
ncbi:MAG: MFS transporter [Planctomycetota bacterium]|nr:MFS transporter [Planctomycetota bacterium]MDA1210905.1 MFS transporter [Planctomycetota bacterium]